MPDEPTPTPAPDTPPERGGEGEEGQDFLESLVNDPTPIPDSPDDDDKYLESLVEEPEPRP
ncbi:MAG: hypothetical protein M3320_00925 [Actinomycetota bacterium]|nr:hypothetical protein [Actinomycetota bacterium]MDQ5807217.1 hypothetical protein [Actinomycetota bacterium]